MRPHVSAQPGDVDPERNGAVRNGTERPQAKTLEAVQRTVAGLLATMSSRPSLVRVQAGDIAVEVRWPRGRGVPTGGKSARDKSAHDKPARDDQVSAERPAHFVLSPLVGTCYRAPKPGADPYVEVGDVVRPGQQVAVVEAMKVMVPVKAEVPGRIAEVLVPDGTAVEYGEPLFAVEPVDSRS